MTEESKLFQVENTQNPCQQIVDNINHISDLISIPYAKSRSASMIKIPQRKGD